MQKIIRRVRAADSITQKPTAPARRLSIGNRRVEEAEQERQALLDDLNTISESDAAIDAAQANKEAALARIDERMRRLKRSTFDNGRLIAELTQQFSRQSVTIDPKKYRAKVTNDQFFASISVLKGEAEKFLGQKEILAISDVVPAKSLGITLKVREMTKKERKG